MTADDAELRGGRGTVVYETAIVNSSGGKFVKERLTVVIVTYISANGGDCPQQSQIVGYIGRTTQGFFLYGNPVDWYRSLGAYAGNLTVIVFVQHYIADNHYFQRLGFRFDKVSKHFLIGHNCPP